MQHRILIVEDDPHFGGQLKELFEFHGHAVRLETSGPAGIAAFEADVPSLVVLDLMLPQVHGLRALETIRLKPGGADVPAILMSAVYRNEALFAQDIKRLGVSAFLAKPFSVIDLGRRVDALFAEPECGRAGVRAALGQAGVLGAPPARTPTGEQPPPPREPARAFDERITESKVPSVELPEERAAPGGRARRRYVHVITHLFHSHRSGRLAVAVDGAPLVLYLLNGYPVWAETERAADLVDWLVAEGLLEAGQAAPLRQHERSSDLLSALAGGGTIADESLAAVLEAWVAWQVRRGLGAAGEHAFEEGDDHAGMVPVFEVNPVRELWEALGDIDAEELWSEAEAMAAGRPVGRTRTFNRLFGYLGASAVARSVGEQFLRTRRLADVRSTVSGAPDEVARTVWLLLAAGLLAVADAADPNAPPAPPPPRPTSSSVAALAARFETRRYGRGTVDALRAATAAPPAAPAEGEAEARIARDYVGKMELDHYGFLGVGREASPEEIDAAYRILAPAYRGRTLSDGAHPDTRRQAKELLAKLVQALEDLGDPVRRARYDATLERAERLGRRPPGAVTPSRPGRLGDEAAQASLPRPSHDPLVGYPGPGADDRLAQRAMALGTAVVGEWRAARAEMRGGDFRRAFSRLEGLRAELPSEPGMLADMAWCRFSLGAPRDARNIAKALEWIELAAAFDRSHPDVVEVHARILIHADADAAAVRALDRVLQQQPELGWAKEELERRRARTEQGTPSLLGGLLGRFGKKDR